MLVKDESPKKIMETNPQILMIIGRRGSGKTTLAKKIIDELSNCVILDFFNEYESEIEIYDSEEFIDYVIEQKGINKKFVSKINDDDENMYVSDFSYQVGDTTIIFEEVFRFCNRHYIAPELQRITFYGRHKNVKSIIIGQRPAQINRDILSQADSFIFFKLTDSRDLNFIEQRFSKETSELVKSLDKYEYVFTND
ncbi:MAG: AAA family ATPase [Candidatus Lokiarchaeota archaeon]|nr:AAA family ATPase [Candidatus Lokiarchaeota archaeon]